MKKSYDFSEAVRNPYLPVAVAQLDEFLYAVYSEANLHPDQEKELRTVVGPHLRFLVSESGVNPREVKRYLNAYTLAVKIKPHLDKDVVLALQTIAFRRDWEIVRRAVLSYRAIFTDAVFRQLGGVLRRLATSIQHLQASLNLSFRMWEGETLGINYYLRRI